MKLRSISFLAIATIGAGIVGAYKLIEKNLKKRVKTELAEAFDQKAKAFEKEMIEKYDIVSWTQGELDEATEPENKDWEEVKIEPLTEEEKDNIDDKEVREANKIDPGPEPIEEVEKEEEEEPEPPLETVEIKPPYAPNPHAGLDLVKYIL